MSAPIASPRQPSPPVDDDPDLGSVIDGRYRLLERVGRGGMGAVYRAEHVGMGREVAVKVLRPELGAHADALARFEREAQASAKLSHKNIVAVSDFGVRSDGSLYLVMEFLKGETLGKRLEREGRLGWPHAIAIARHVARGLAHAHAKGVVHRDIKPDNIFLIDDEDDPYFAKIVDFGIARLSGGGDPNVTRAGLVVGTPAYLSPEQALGNPIDGRSDLYSLCVVLYEMLTGRTPFADREPVAMLTAHAVADPPWFIEVAPALGMPDAIEMIVRRGLAKARDDRFADANELSAALDEVRTRSGSWPISAGLVAFGEPSSPLLVLGQGGASPAFVSGPTMALGTQTGMRAWVHATFPWTRERAKVKKVLTLGGAGILVVGLVAAIATASNPPTGGATAAATEPSRETAPAAPAPPAIPPVALPSAPAIADGSREDQFRAAVQELQKGKTCPERKAAVAKLRELGDARAVPALKRARYRMRGGFIGIGDSNTNACLRADADATIAELSKTP